MRHRLPSFRYPAILLSTWVATIAVATITDPVLALSRVVAESGIASRLVQIDGSFPHEDLVQLAYPLQVLIRSGGDYVRFDLSAGAVTGFAPELADGLDVAEAIALVDRGTPSAEARVVFLGDGRIEVLLPASHPSGAAEAQLFFLYKGTAILSNPIPFQVEAMAP